MFCDTTLLCPIHTLDRMVMFIASDDTIPIKYMHIPSDLSWAERHQLYPEFLDGTRLAAVELTSYHYPHLMFFLLYVTDPSHDDANQRVESAICGVEVAGDALVIAVDEETGEDVPLPDERWQSIQGWRFVLREGPKK